MFLPTTCDMVHCRGNLNYNKITIEKYLQNCIILPMQQVQGSVQAMYVHRQRGAAGNEHHLSSPVPSSCSCLQEDLKSLRHFVLLKMPTLFIPSSISRLESGPCRKTFIAATVHGHIMFGW